jgi:hypothetical protein
MLKAINLLLLTSIIIFSLSTYRFYTSNKNLKSKNLTRKNIDQIINEKILNIPTLANNTNNVIEFNNSLSNEINSDKPRSFWKLLKIK